MFQNAKIISVGTDAQQYHAAKKAFPRGSSDYPVSPSMLKEYDKSPRRWKRGYVPPDSKAKEWGSRFDTLILSPELFPKRYITPPDEYEAKGTRKGETVMKPWDRRSKTCRAWESEHEAKGIEIATPEEIEEVHAAKASFLADEIGRFIAHCENQVLVRGEWMHQDSGLIIPVECLIDLVPDKKCEFSSCLADLKSSRNASTRVWQSEVLERSYHTQAAFNLDLFNAATGEERSTFCFLIVENFEPFEPAKKILSQEYLELGRGEVHRMLSNYAVCLANGKWPSYDDLGESAQGWGLIKPPPWAVSQSEYAARFELDEEEADEMPEPSHPN